MHYWLVNKSMGIHDTVPQLPRLQNYSIQPSMYQGNVPVANEALSAPFAVPALSPPAAASSGFYMQQNPTSVYPSQSPAAMHSFFSLSINTTNQATSIPVYSSSQPHYSATPYGQY
jgi:hypothetical protein